MKRYRTLILFPFITANLINVIMTTPVQANNRLVTEITGLLGVQANHSANVSWRDTILAQHFQFLCPPGSAVKFVNDVSGDPDAHYGAYSPYNDDGHMPTALKGDDEDLHLGPQYWEGEVDLPDGDRPTPVVFREVSQDNNRLVSCSYSSTTEPEVVILFPGNDGEGFTLSLPDNEKNSYQQNTPIMATPNN